MKKLTMRQKFTKHIINIVDDVLTKLDPHSAKYEELRKLIRDLDNFKCMYIGD